ncbi:MAG: DUF1343 domain-containing protein, partial [Bryobacteraceae bacterium]|nr:DUF1343 domain-containing protein [Bryobacteraceae bacterium]
FVVLLTNSVHPKLRAPITSLRGRVASAAAAGLRLTRLPGLDATTTRHRFSATPARNSQNSVLTGIDVLMKENFQTLRGKRVGFITNHTGITRDGKRSVDAMIAAGVNVKALYSPEHGIGGTEDREDIGSQRDTATGLPIWSLYQAQNRRPTDEMLRDVDFLVFDIQDIGSRFYTYVCTMKNAMEEAAHRKIGFVVLDRPNPITGEHVEGPMLDPDAMSLTGCAEIPIRHGMTAGELAQMMNATLQPKADLRVIKMTGWHRSDWFDSTGLIWVNPSPNIRSLTAALFYPGIGMFEGGKVYSVGRGTDAPFEQIGADWIDGQKLAQYLNAREVPGIRVYPAKLNPVSSNFEGKTIDGIRLVLTDRDSFNSVRFGTELGIALEKLFPGKMNWIANGKLAGNQRFLSSLAKDDAAQIERDSESGLQSFKLRRAEFLLY